MHNNVDESHKRNIEWNKPDTKDFIYKMYKSRPEKPMVLNHGSAHLWRVVAWEEGGGQCGKRATEEPRWCPSWLLFSWVFTLKMRQAVNIYGLLYLCRLYLIELIPRIIRQVIALHVAMSVFTEVPATTLQAFDSMGKSCAENFIHLLPFDIF